MARGRIIVSEICSDKRISDLSDDTSRLAFTWLVTFADREGRTHGDPALVRSMLFPRRDDVTVERMESYLREWAACGLVRWYEAKGDKWVWFTSFSKHQVGFDRRHERASVIPAPPETGDGTDAARTEPVPSTTPVLLKLKEAEVNRSEAEAEVKGAAARNNGNTARLFELVHAAGITIGGTTVADEYECCLADANGDMTLIEAAFKEAAANTTAPTPKWLRAVIARCRKENMMPGQWRGKRSTGPPGHPPPRDMSLGLTADEERCNAIAFADVAEQEAREAAEKREHG